MAREKRSTCVKCGRKRPQSKMNGLSRYSNVVGWNRNWHCYPSHGSWQCSDDCIEYESIKIGDQEI